MNFWSNNESGKEYSLSKPQLEVTEHQPAVRRWGKWYSWNRQIGRERWSLITPFGSCVNVSSKGNLIQIDDSDFLSISLIENWVFYFAMISIGRRKYSHQLTDFKFKGEAFCNYFFIFCNVALGKMVSVATNIQTLNYKNIRQHLHLEPEKSHR